MDIVIFGISGDLAHKKLIPALNSLFGQKKLPIDSRLIGFSRSVKEVTTYLPYSHIEGGYTDKKIFLKLKEMLREDKPQLFYIALPPFAYRDVLTSLHEAEIITKDDPAGFRTILLEKPFGEGYKDALDLSKLVKEYFRPDQLLKVDHYAGKKELRDIEDENFESMSKVSFSIKDKATVGHRAGFYDKVGAVRDIAQNHLLFMLATFFKSEGKREDVLETLKVESDASKYVFGHYEGYTPIETYFSIPAPITKEGAEHISITLSGGKGLDETKTAIDITYTSGVVKEIVFASGTEAYENIFLDGIEGKQSSFLSDEEVLSAWKFIEQIEKIKSQKTLISYPIGSKEIIV